MPVFRTGSAGALLLAAHAGALAQSTPAPVPQVVISASAAASRTGSTTTSIAVTRDDLERHGDASLADVLKRQPGITVDAVPGRGAAIRMRGLGGGYVAILLDGLPAPAGFSLESLSPDMIERIDIQRVATAETSAQAVAGTINVILRRAGPARGLEGGEVKAGSAVTGGYAAPQLVAQTSGRAGTLAYTLAATLRRNRNPIAAISTEEGRDPTLLRATAWTDNQIEDVAELAPRLAWQPNARDSITSQSYVRKRRIDNVKRETETLLAGVPTAYPHAWQRYRTDPLNAYADLAWNRKLDAGARLAMKLSGFYTTRDADFLYRGMDTHDNLLRTNAVASGPTEREWTFNGSWRRPLGRSHTLAAGWEAGRKERTEYRREHQRDAGGALLLASDEDYRADVQRSAFFIQDEFDLGRAWSAYLGLRREELRTTGAGNAAAAVDVDAGAWSPILQALYKPAPAADDDSPNDGPRDGYRIAISRSYKAPDIIQLMPRRYTVDNNNNATDPDFQGNPGLRPELSFNLDLAWERTFGKDDMVGISAFHKRIRDITLTTTTNNGGVWIAMPENRGAATVRGIEFEGKATRGALAARVNLARTWSRIDSVPGPDNRIAGQPAWSGNLGFDYVSAARRIDVGGTLGYRGGSISRSSAQLVSEDGVKRQLDLYAVFKRDARSRLRLSASNLLRQDYHERSAFEGDGALARSTAYRVRATWRLVWEQSL